MHIKVVFLGIFGITLHGCQPRLKEQAPSTVVIQSSQLLERLEYDRRTSARIKKHISASNDILSLERGQFNPPLKDFIEDNLLSHSVFARSPDQYKFRMFDLDTSPSFYSDCDAALESKVADPNYGARQFVDFWTDDEDAAHTRYGIRSIVFPLASDNEFHIVKIEIAHTMSEVSNRDGIQGSVNLFLKQNPESEVTWDGQDKDELSQLSAEETSLRGLTDWVRHSIEDSALGVRWYELVGKRDPLTGSVTRIKDKVHYIVIQPLA